MVILKKIVKITLAIMIISTFIMTQNTHGLFGVAEGDKIGFKILASDISFEFGTLGESYSGFIVNQTVIEVGTSFDLLIEEITPTSLTWNSTIEGNDLQGTCSTDFDTSIISDIFCGYHFSMMIDFNIIYTSGITNLEHLDLLYIPPFINIAPVTWALFEDMITGMDSAFGGNPNIQYDGSNFMEFLDTYKWYFIGGAGGLFILVITFTIIIKVRKR